MFCSQQARALLSVIVVPLLRHLSRSEYEDIIISLDRAEVLLSYPIEELNKLVVNWRLQNIALLIDWVSLPLDGTDNYCFGALAPVQGFQLEDTLTPLPYPTKSFPHDRLSALLGREGHFESHFTSVPDVGSHYFGGLSHVALPALEADGRAMSWTSDSSGSAGSDEIFVDHKLCQDRKRKFSLKSGVYYVDSGRYLIHGKPHLNNREHVSRFPIHRRIWRRMQSGVKALLMAQ